MASWIDVTNGDHSMPALVYAGVSALAKLATSKKHAHIRQECQNVQNHIHEQQKKNQEAVRAGQPATVDVDANKYFLIFKLACDTGVSKLMCLALDIMQKLISFGYLDGTTVADPRIYPNPNAHARAAAVPISQMQQKIAAVIAEGVQDAIPAADGASNGSNGTAATSSTSDTSLTSLTGLSPGLVLSAAGSDGRLIAVIIDTLYQCSCYKDQQVQLLVLKCVLTCITSASCSVHGWTLLQAVSTCFQVYLANPTQANNAGEEINRVTAKATLTQIFNLSFQRMEHFAQQLKQMQSVSAVQQPPSASTSQQQQHPNGNGKATDPLLSPDPSTSPLPTPSPDPSTSDPASSTVSALPSASSGQSSSGNSLKPPLHPTGASALTTQTGMMTPGRRGFCIVCNKPANHYCFHTKAVVCGLECKIAHLRKVDPEEKLQKQLMRKIMIQLELCQNDSYYLLKALCKLAIKVLPPMGGQDKHESTIAVDSKILSLQLLLSVLSNAGPTFRTTKHFISCVKGDLVNVILRNSAASSIDTIFALSSSMFVSMVCHFKPHLHAVIGPVLDSIYLPYIASPNSTFEHKYISLTVLHKIALDPQTLLEIFINYDCDTGSISSTYQKLATAFEKVCRSRFVTENWLSSVEESRLRLLALEGLVDTIKSLLSWTKRAQQNIIQRKSEADAALLAMANSGYESDEEKDVDTSLTSTSGGTHRHTPSSRFTSLATPTPSNAGGLGSSDETSLVPSFSMQQFHALRQQKQKLDTGILRFNMKPKKGLVYLEQHGVLHADNPKEIAEFFHQNVGTLDKITVGEYMGEEAELNKQVLYAYTERFDFHHCSFDEAIRKFLNGFWLPGEAQKIDRMMEKFAEVYHRHNPGMFSSADTAYVLAYSVIMLNTDAHKAGIKHRMTKEEFFKNTRGIDDGKDVDPVFLGDIYDRITTNEIKMKDDPHRRVPASSRSSGPRRENRLEMFAVESQELVKKTQDYLDAFQRKHEAEIKAQEMGGQAALDLAQDPARRRLSTEEAESKLFQQATDADLEAIRPMFDILWYPSLATFSVLLEENEGKTIDYAATATGHNSSSHHFRIIELCLEGYRAAIRLSSALNIETSRLAFVTSLRKFTLLGSTRELRPSSIEAIKMLLLISATEGNHLADSWIDVLQCISELERLHLFASSRPIADVFQSSPLRTRESDSVNSQHVNKIDASSIDRVFTSSAHLDSDAIVDFVKALRKVSEQELSNVSAPRVFSLQKIVEITYYNMGRIRVVWSKIWSVLSAYFIRAGCHPNLNVSMYAIDSLRQLATKFLEKDELAHYMFQKQFFKPFELIMLNNTSNETRELIVQCMHRMVASRVTNIKSGWKGVFVVIHTAASQTYQPLVVAGFELLTIIMDQHFHLLTSTTDTTDELIRCLVAFGCCNLTAISLKAIYYINQCCDHLGAQQVLRREKIAARQTQAENHLSIDPAADPLSTPSRSRGTSVTRDQELSVSVPSSPAVGPAAATMGPEEELDIGLLSPTSSASATASTMQVDLKIWFLALTGLSRMVLDPRLEVRSRALLALFKILASHGSHFSPSTWRAVFCGVLFPIFDDVRHAGDSRGKRPGTAGGSGQTGSGAERRDGSNSGESTPTREDGSSAVFSIASSHRSGGWAPHHASPWRNPSNWSWPAGALTPRQSSRPSPLTQSAATVVNEPNQRREPLTPTPSGLASVTTAQAVQVPSATATPTQVTRAIPQLPPKPPQNPSAANNPRLPTIPAPVPSVVQQKQQQASRPAVQAVTPENSWLQTTCFSALSTLVELFDHFYSSVSFMLPDLLSLIHSCISQESSEDLAKIGIKCLIMLITKSGAKLSVSAWWTALESIAEIVQRTMPLELMTPKLRGILGLPDLEPQAHVPHTAEDKPSDVPAAESSSTSNSRAGSRAGSRRNSASLAAGPSATTAAAVAIAAAGAQPSTNGLNGSADAAEPTAASATPVISIDAVPGGAPLTVNARAPSPLTVPSPSPQPLPGMPASPATQARAAGVSLSPLPPPNSSVPSSLPFSSSVVVGKFRVQLQLLEAVWQVADGFFPVKPSEKAREKNAKAGGRKHQQQTSQVIEKPGELDFLSGNGASASPTDASSAAVTQRMHSSEEIVLGHLTCEQLFFTLDLLSSSLSFARAFNLNLVLRRKLYSFGFQTEQTLLGRLPQLFLQETRATRLLMQLMLRLVQEGGDGESEQHEKEAMNGERWQAMQAAGGWEEETHANGATPIQSSYEAYVRLAEARSIGIALRFLADYVSKTVSGQLVSLEFSEELLGSFLDNLHSIARVSPTRFSNYMSIFYFPLVQLISFGKESIRQHLGLLFQLAMPSTLSFQPITPYPLQRVVPPVLPPVGTDSTPFPGHAPQSTSSAPTTAGAAH